MKTRFAFIRIKDAKGNFTDFRNSNSIGARIEFSIIQNPCIGGGGLSTAQISIFNLNDDTFKYIAQQGKSISLTVGYNDSYAEIFNGSILTVIRAKEGTDIITKIYGNENGIDTSTLNILWKPEAFNSISLDGLLNKLATDTGFTIIKPNLNNILITNKTFYGTVQEILNQLAFKYQLSYSVHGSVITIYKVDDGNRPTFTFTPESGLLKLPIITEKGVDIEVFLEPKIRPDNLFILNSKFATFNLGAMEFVERVRDSYINTQANQFVRGVNKDFYEGKYRALMLQHEGSTHTNTWYTRIDGITYTR